MVLSTLRGLILCANLPCSSLSGTSTHWTGCGISACPVSPGALSVIKKTVTFIGSSTSEGINWWQLLGIIRDDNGNWQGGWAGGFVWKEWQFHIKPQLSFWFLFWHFSLLSSDSINSLIFELIEYVFYRQSFVCFFRKDNNLLLLVYVFPGHWQSLYGIFSSFLFCREGGWWV